MKFLSVRELRNRPGQVRDMVSDEDVVLTVNGKPVAVLVGVREGDLEETLTLLRRGRAQAAVSRMRRTAQEQGASALTADDVETEIRAARNERRPA